MLSLKQPLEYEIEIEGNRYYLDLSYDNVLRWYDLTKDDTYDDVDKIKISFDMFVKDCPQFDIETKIATVNEIAKYLMGKSDDGEEEVTEQYEAQPEYFCFEQDAPYIYSSFRQQYGINLLKEKGILRWEEFIALLNGLSSETKFMEIVGIRSAEPPTGNEPHDIAERNRLTRLQQIYALKSDKNVQFMEQQMSNLMDSLIQSAIEKGGKS